MVTDTSSVELATGSKRYANIALYQRLGFTQYRNDGGSVYLRKSRVGG